MAELRAIDVALNFARMPALAKQVETIELPRDVSEVICIAAESPEACSAAAAATGHSPDLLIEASRFYVQQVLLQPNSSPHRVLGINPGASREEARRHMKLLLRWLHPDRNESLEAIYARRVINAWKQLDVQGAFVEDAARSNDPIKTSPSQSAQFRINSHRLRMPLIARSMEARATGRLTKVLGVFGGVLLVFVLFWTAQFWFVFEK